MSEEKKEKTAEEKKTPKFEEKLVKTEHSIKLNGKELNYTAVAGTIVLYDEEDKKAPQPKGEIFYIAYTLNGVKDLKSRPITFSFNGPFLSSIIPLSI